MSDKLNIEFIDGDPPVSAKGEGRKLPVSWIGYVIGVLISTPYKWAILHDISPENGAAYGNRIVARANELGVTVEVLTRRGALYARAVGEDS